MSLKAIESLTYTCNEPELLLQLNKTLDDVLLKFRRGLPSEQGLVVRPLVERQTKKTEREMKAKNGGKILSLPPYKKRGRACLDSKYRNRVGKRASQLRKVSKFCACILL